MIALNRARAGARHHVDGQAPGLVTRTGRRRPDLVRGVASTPQAATPAETVVAYTDGACIGNPGPGGWGVHITEPDGSVRELGGGEPHTTNNRMELRAAIEAVLATLDAPAVTIVTDSQYVQRGITQWLRGWKRSGWMNSDGKPVKNQDLWRELDDLADERVTWEWRRAHAGDPGNERAHQLAYSSARRQAALSLM